MVKCNTLELSQKTIICYIPQLQKNSASLVEAELNAELKRLVSLNPSARKFKPLVKETKSNNEVNDTGNNIPIPLENIGTYIPPLRITQQRSTSKQPPREMLRERLRRVEKQLISLSIE